MSAQPPNPELAALPDLFLVNEKNRAFVEGKLRRIAIYPKVRKEAPLPWLLQGGCVQFIPQCLVLTAVLYFMSTGLQFATSIVSAHFHLDPYITCFGLLGFPTLVLFLIVNYRKRRRHRRLVEDGCLLIGHMNAWRTEEDWEFPNIFICQLGYVFHTLNGHRRDDTVVIRLREEQIRALGTPKTGVPLAVLYVNDHLYEVL